MPYRQIAKSGRDTHLISRPDYVGQAEQFRADSQLFAFRGIYVDLKPDSAGDELEIHNSAGSKEVVGLSNGKDSSGLNRSEDVLQSLSFRLGDE
jgi:hypothetical protein